MKYLPDPSWKSVSSAPQRPHCFLLPDESWKQEQQIQQTQPDPCGSFSDVDEPLKWSVWHQEDVLIWITLAHLKNRCHYPLFIISWPGLLPAWVRRVWVTGMEKLIPFPGHCQRWPGPNAHHGDEWCVNEWGEKPPPTRNKASLMNNVEHCFLIQDI